jgi:hypothetical protein
MGGNIDIDDNHELNLDLIRVEFYKNGKLYRSSDQH